MKYRGKKKILTAGVIVILGLLMTSCGRGKKNYISDSGETPEIQQTAEGHGTTKDYGAEANETGKGSENHADESQESPSGEQNAEPISGTYFKSGDFTYQLRIYPGDLEHPDTPKLEFMKRNPEISNSYTHLHSLFLENRETGTYTLADEINGHEGTSCEISWNPDGPVVLHGDMDEAGTYYSTRNLLMPEILERPLNDTDVIGLTPEDMKLMRNQFYAVYGRKFTTQEMKDYFEGQPWYQPRFEADQFDESILSGLEKRNIAFLKAAEASYNEKKAQEVKSVYDALPAAPYCELLPDHGEISVQMYSDFEHTADRGIYYEAEGTISVPVTITREEYLELIDGKELEVVADGITGETVILKKAENTQYGDYVLMDSAIRDEDTASYVEFTYDPVSQSLSMWTNSADTIFKRVYEGNIYVLKGACEEYYNYFNLLKPPHGGGAFRVMEFHEDSPYGPSPYQGNILVMDSKGYIKALYFMGD